MRDELGGSATEFGGIGLDGDGDTDIYDLPEAPQGRVVVIGSGATAATLVPAIADEVAASGGTLTLLQR